MVFTEEESEAAAAYLKKHDLIASIDTSEADHTLVWITERGRECVDSGLTLPAFVSPPRGPEPSVSHVYNMAGSGNSFATATASRAVANASVQNFNIDHARLFAAAVRTAAADLDLTDEATSALAEIEQDHGDEPRAHQATKALYSFLIATTSGSLGQVLGMLGASALGIGT